MAGTHHRTARGNSHETTLHGLLQQLRAPLMIMGAYSLMLQHRLRHGHDIETQLRIDHLTAIERATYRIEKRAYGREFDVEVVRRQAARHSSRAHPYVLGSIHALRSVSREREDIAGSLAYYRECVSLLGEQGDLGTIVVTLEQAAAAAAAWGQPAKAARILGAADALAGQSGGRTTIAARAATHERTRAAIRAALQPEEARSAWMAGRRLPLPLALAEVLALKAPSDPPPIASGETLSRRESEVLRLLAEGCSDQEIARKLHLSPRTIEAHVRRLRVKLGARTRTGAVSTAIAAGLVDPRRVRPG